MHHIQTQGKLSYFFASLKLLMTWLASCYAELRALEEKACCKGWAL